jgi:hypothetical protein
MVGMIPRGVTTPKVPECFPILASDTGQRERVLLGDSSGMKTRDKKGVGIV